MCVISIVYIYQILTQLIKVLSITRRFLRMYSQVKCLVIRFKYEKNTPHIMPNSIFSI